MSPRSPRTPLSPSKKKQMTVSRMSSGDSDVKGGIRLTKRGSMIMDVDLQKQV